MLRKQFRKLGLKSTDLNHNCWWNCARHPFGTNLLNRFTDSRRIVLDQADRSLGFTPFVSSSFATIGWSFAVQILRGQICLRFVFQAVRQGLEQHTGDRSRSQLVFRSEQIQIESWLTSIELSTENPFMKSSWSLDLTFATTNDNKTQISWRQLDFKFEITSM